MDSSESTLGGIAKNVNFHSELVFVLYVSGIFSIQKIARNSSRCAGTNSAPESAKQPSAKLFRPTARGGDMT